jgi:uncharacterized membrane protein
MAFTELLKIIFLSIIPISELRGAIPFAVYSWGKEAWPAIFFITVVSNIVIGLLVFLSLKYTLDYVLRIKFLDNLYQKIVVRTERKMKAHFKHFDQIEKVGLALFIGIPIPGSGVYTGALIGSLLEFEWKDFLMACIVGTVIAGVIVTAISYSGSSALSFLLKGH